MCTSLLMTYRIFIIRGNCLRQFEQRLKNILNEINHGERIIYYKILGEKKQD
jgi:hypothetical protein